jgi:LPS-assembly protein
MKSLRALLLCCGAVSVFAGALEAQEIPALQIESLSDDNKLVYDFATSGGMATNGVKITYGDTILTARKVTWEQKDGGFIASAEGDVRLQRGQEVWSGERLRYNFNSKELAGDHFRTGQAPFFVAGEKLLADMTNQTHTVSNAFVTTDDLAAPEYRIQAKSLRLVPGKYLEARDALLYLGDVPVFYFPYYRRDLGPHPNNFVFTPGYRSRYGPYLLTAYNWHLNENFDTSLHLDYRERRGVGLGPDFNYDAGQLGKGNFQSYYAHDNDPTAGGGTNVTTRTDRYRISFSHALSLRTNLTAKVVVREQSDLYVVRDFFETEYRKNVQPASFLEVNQLWPNFSLNLLAQPQINNFFETVERLPDIKLTAVRQQLGISPFYYEAENSVGYFRHDFTTPATNNFAAFRADTFHQLLLPYTFFGWLNVTPRVGGRFTYYGETDGYGSTLDEQDRAVFNTGAEVSFKASRVYRTVESKFWDLHELRHIVEPSVNYVYVPSPNALPPELPQFDSELASFRLLPITFPDYNSIDSIDSQNVIRFTVRNKLQTKRTDGVENVVNWALYTDWRLRPRPDQSTFADFCSDLDFKPRSWFDLTSEVRYDLANERFRLANHYALIHPNNIWSLALGHRYLIDDPQTYGAGDNLITGSLYYRLNENWAARVSYHFDAREGTLQEQYYTIFRDLRSWTAALTFRARNSTDGSTDFSVAVTFSLKAFPRLGTTKGHDTPSMLLGS